MGPSATTIAELAAESSTFLTAEDLEVPPSTLSALTRQGGLVRLAPGVYLGANHRQHPLAEAAAWAHRHPWLIACLYTAAAYHGLTDAFPRGTWLFYPSEKSPPRSRVTQLHTVRADRELLAVEPEGDNDITIRDVHGVRLAVTGPDRTTIDLWRYPRHVTYEHAEVALRRRVAQGGFDRHRFSLLAQRMGIWERVAPTLQGTLNR